VKCTYYSEFDSKEVLEFSMIFNFIYLVCFPFASSKSLPMSKITGIGITAT